MYQNRWTTRVQKTDTYIKEKKKKKPLIEYTAPLATLACTLIKKVKYHYRDNFVFVFGRVVVTF